MCLRRPTVSNLVGDIKSLIEQNDTGLLADWNPSDFANKIIKLLENPDQATKLGENVKCWLSLSTIGRC